MFDFSISKSTCIQSLGNERIERMEEQEEESVREIQRSFKSQSAGRPRGKGDCKSRQGSMEWEAWKKKEKIKTRRSGAERERCTISFMSDPLKFHSTIGSNLRPVRLSLRSKPVVSNLFPPSFVFWKARFEQRLIFTERNRFRDCFFLVSEERLEKNWKGEREKRKNISEIFRGMLANAEGEIGNARFLVARELTRHTCEDKPAEMA